MQKRCSTGKSGGNSKILDIVCENYRFNSPASFCDKYKQLLFTSKDLGRTNGVKFYMYKQTYARYGTYYLRQIGSLDSTHPGAYK